MISILNLHLTVTSQVTLQIKHAIRWEKRLRIWIKNMAPCGWQSVLNISRHLSDLEGNTLWDFILASKYISKHIVSLDGIYYYILCLVNGVELEKVWYADSSLTETLIQIYVLYTKVLGGFIAKPKTVELALSHSSRVRGFGGLMTKPKLVKVVLNHSLKV